MFGSWVSATVDIWSLLILFGTLHGYFLAVVLIFHKKGNRKANGFLALLLIAFSLHLTEYAIAITGLISQTPHLLASTYPLVLLVGPFYYFYALSLLQRDFSMGVRELIINLGKFQNIQIISPSEFWKFEATFK